MDCDEIARARVMRHVFLGRYMRQSISDIERMTLSEAHAYIEELEKLFKAEGGGTAIEENYL